MIVRLLLADSAADMNVSITGRERPVKRKELTFRIRNYIMMGNGAAADARH